MPIEMAYAHAGCWLVLDWGMLLWGEGRLGRGYWEGAVVTAKGLEESPQLKVIIMRCSCSR